MFSGTAVLEKEFFDLWETQVFELAATTGYEHTKIAELAVNKASEIMMRKHGLSMPEMVRIVEKAIKNHN